jgi:hypothetical protein
MKIVRLAIVALSLVANFESFAASCAKAWVESGSECNSLQVKFDLSQCPDGPKEIKLVASECDGSGAVARFKEHSAKFQKNSDPYALGAWALKSIDAAPIKTAEKKQEKRKPSSTPSSISIPKLAATQAPPPPTIAVAPPAVEEAKSDNGITFSGNLDFYIQHNFNNPPIVPSTGNTIRPAQTKIRYYDIYSDSFQLNAAALSVRKNASPVGFRIDFAFGSWADQNSADEVGKHLATAFITFKPTDRLTLNLGKLNTHMGLELPYAQDNFNYSRMFLYGYGLPFWHTGLQLEYKWSDKVTTSFFINNGWAIDLYDNNNTKSVGAQLIYTPSDSLTLVYGMISGPEQTGDDVNVRTTHNLNATWKATPALTLALDSVYGRDTTAGALREWSAVAAMAKVMLTSDFSISPRFEVFNDKDGYLIPGATSGRHFLYGATLTATKDWGKGFETRLEGRYDKSNQTVFSRNGADVDSQTTLTLAFLYRF